MDTLTHAIAGYAIARSGLASDTGKWGSIAGVTAAALPDADSILAVFFGTGFMIEYHRSLPNSLFLALPFSLAFGWLFVKVSKRRRFWTFFTLGLVEFLAHTFLDLITSYGTMILSPFSYRRFALDWVFIIDLFLTSSLVLPMIASLLLRRKGPALARLALVLAATYIAGCAINHSRALSLAKNKAQRCGLQTRHTASLPQPLSPFHWANYIVTEERIYEGFVDLLRRTARPQNPGGSLLRRIRGRYQPVSQLKYRAWERIENSPWVDKALALKGTQTFLNFARFPLVRYRGLPDGSHVVTLFDLRFGSIDGRRPFMYTVHFDSGGDVIFQGFGEIACGSTNARMISRSALEEGKSASS